MKRAVAVLVAVIVLLAAGWWLGHRSTGALQSRVEALELDLTTRTDSLEAAVRQAEARGYLWQARAELLLAAHDVEQKNFGTANQRAVRARDLIQRAAAPRIGVDLGDVPQMVDSAIGKTGALDLDAVDVLNRAAAELGRRLEAAGPN